MSYEDLKVIEAYTFLRAVVENKQAEPGFEAAVRVAEVHDTVIRSWDSKRWGEVKPVEFSRG